MKNFSKALGCIILLLGSVHLGWSADTASQEIVTLNAQIQGQIKALQSQQEQQLLTLNAQLQAQIKKMQATLQTQMQQLNAQTQTQMKQIQTTLEQQIASVKKN